MNLKDKVLLITGATRGIGHAIAMKAAKDGAKIAVIGKTKTPHPKLPGTIYTAVQDIENAGGRALPLACDIRFEDQVENAVLETFKKFGGIDILVNNASAIRLSDTEHTPIKAFDLMFSVNVRGSFLCAQKCLPYLKKSKNPHILNLSPPLNLKPQWFSQHLAYTLSKYGMSECVLGMAEEFKDLGIGVNALWPKTTIATAAIENIVGGTDMMAHCRKPEIMADAAYWIFTQDAKTCTGNFFIDEAILKKQGIQDFAPYAIDSSQELQPDLFL
ncbi:MAG: short chain dehydrogenase [Deltaproteobacteria bacterium RIFCSPHIGHO2_02_FULL_40_11]|nr:MAG: short chain dehydrogenase [Deltaproteobacteria bacterium RIFCSPHIGHO2_02_FULL_40_11]